MYNYEVAAPLPSSFNLPSPLTVDTAANLRILSILLNEQLSSDAESSFESGIANAWKSAQGSSRSSFSVESTLSNQVKYVKSTSYSAVYKVKTCLI